MNEQKFNSQICTTKEQSQRLLDLGLKPETADMCYQTHYLDLGGVLKECVPSLEPYPPVNNDRFIPAWSLHRLITILTPPFIEFNIDTGNPYEEVIYNISECIKYGYINKEYLKQ